MKFGFWVSESRVGEAHLEGALLELHHAGVVDTGALGEDQDGQSVRVLDVLLEVEQEERGDQEERGELEEKDEKNGEMVKNHDKHRQKYTEMTCR